MTGAGTADIATLMAEMGRRARAKRVTLSEGGLGFRKKTFRAGKRNFHATDEPGNGVGETHAPHL